MQAERKCLKCGKMFESMNKGNRICPKCKGLKGVPTGSGPVDANKRLKKVLRDKKIKPDIWRGNNFVERDDHDEEEAGAD